MSKTAMFKKSIAAGVLIGIGAVIKLLSADGIVGSVLFSIGLFFICTLDMYLFTGKIGYINKENWKDYPIIWIGNLLGAIISMALVRIAVPELHNIVQTIMMAKIENNILSTMILSLFCGIIMYLCVDNYKKSESGISKVFGIVIGVTVFLLAGFEHSIADMAYASLFVSNFIDVINSIIFLLIVSAFNAIGSNAIRFLLK